MNQEIIDVHTHVFNLHYLPVSGILISRGVPEIIARGVAFIFIKLTGNSNLNIEFKSDQFTTLSAQTSFSEIVNELQDIEIAGIVADAVSPKIFNNASVQMALIQHDKTNGIDINNTFIIDEYNAIKENPIELKKYIYNKIINLLKAYEGIMHYIKWFFFMMRSEDRIHDNLLTDYGHIKIFVFHMMDPWRFFAGRPKYSMKSKIKRMHNFIKKSNHHFIGFVAYNPRRAKHLKVVKDALKLDGFKGIKFYPPMGYRPSQNKEAVEGIPNVKYGKEIDARVEKLFEYTVENDIPVFTHCTPTGFEAIPKKSGKNAHPRFWRALLVKDRFKNLRICLGHAGGVEGWFAEREEEFEKSYAKIVYDLCVTYPNVYCEVGFLADIKESDKRENFISRLGLFFKSEKENGNYNFSDKIMYGSDWHILFNHGIHKRYDKEYETIFEDPNLKDYRNKFFVENAKNYLKIN